MHVFCPWSSLRMSACTVPRTVASVHARILAASSSVGSRPLSLSNFSSCWSIAAFMYIARIVGAGPLIVIEIDVAGSVRSKPPVQHLEIVERGDRHAGIADLAVDVGADRRVVAVERDRVERGGQPLGRHAVGKQVEAPVGAVRVALAREHPRRVLVLALEREHAGGERKAARHVLQELPAEDFRCIVELRQRDLGYVRAGQRRRGERRANLLAADLHDVLVAGIGGLGLRPHVEQLLRARILPGIAGGGQRVEFRHLLAALRGEHGPGPRQLLPFARDPRLLVRPLVVLADRLRDLGQVARSATAA